jgi:hypothetical protein
VIVSGLPPAHEFAVGFGAVLSAVRIEEDDAVDVASLRAVNARGAGRCVQVNVVDR